MKKIVLAKSFQNIPQYLDILPETQLKEQILNSKSKKSREPCKKN